MGLPGLSGGPEPACCSLGTPGQLGCLGDALMLRSSHFQPTGVAHMDLKPENVMRQTNGVLRLIDYGGAESFEPAAGLDLAWVDDNGGTEAYMAPERRRHRLKRRPRRVPRLSAQRPATPLECDRPRRPRGAGCGS